MRLTQGAALLGLGVSGLACSKDPPHVNAPPPEEPHINATATPPSASPTGSTSAAPSAATDPEPPLKPHTNATATPVGSAPPKVHLNAPPKKP